MSVDGVSDKINDHDEEDVLRPRHDEDVIVGVVAVTVDRFNELLVDRVTFEIVGRNGCGVRPDQNVGGRFRDVVHLGRHRRLELGFGRRVCTLTPPHNRPPAVEGRPTVPVPWPQPLEVRGTGDGCLNGDALPFDQVILPGPGRRGGNSSAPSTKMPRFGCVIARQRIMEHGNLPGFRDRLLSLRAKDRPSLLAGRKAWRSLPLSSAALSQMSHDPLPAHHSDAKAPKACSRGP
jgi:hypothetical protein